LLNLIKKYLIIDTSAILSGKQLNLNDFIMVTSSSVINEIKPGGKEYRKLQYLLEKGLYIFKPLKKSLDKIQNMSKKTGDISRLSETDIDILAIALELYNKKDTEVVILSDDYSIQNLSNYLKIKYLNVSQSGITKRFKWSYKCQGCGKKFNNNIKICPVCGSSIRNFIIKTKKIIEHK
jgi:UPF0271 protein